MAPEPLENQESEFDPDVLRWAAELPPGLPDGHPDLRPEDEEEPLDPSDPFYNLNERDGNLFTEAMNMRRLSSEGAFKERFSRADAELQEAFRAAYGYEPSEEDLAWFDQQRDLEDDQGGDPTGTPEDLGGDPTGHPEDQVQ